MPIQFSTSDLKSPESLERVLRQFELAISAPPPKPASIDPAKLAELLAPFMRDELQAPGRTPLNLQSLLPGAGSTVVIEDTHANRLTTYPPASYEVGTMFYETDRTVYYIIVLSGGVNVWQYSAGTYFAALASIPVDLGTNDARFRFVANNTAQNAEYMWTGTAFVTIDYLQEVLDSATVTATVTRVLRHTTSGTANTGFGVIDQHELEDANGVTEIASQTETNWTTATSGSETSSWTVALRNAGAAAAKKLFLFASGLLMTVGNLALGAGTAFLGTFTHANSADRVYTLPNADGNVTYATAALTSGQILTGGGGALVQASGGAFATGKFTPTLSNIANLTASTAYDVQYTALGDNVIVSGRFDADPTAAASTDLYMTLPIAPINNFTTQERLGGACCPEGGAGPSPAVEAVNVAGVNYARFNWLAVDLTNRGYTFIFMYSLST